MLSSSSPSLSKNDPPRETDMPLRGAAVTAPHCVNQPTIFHCTYVAYLHTLVYIILQLPTHAKCTPIVICAYSTIRLLKTCRSGRGSHTCWCKLAPWPTVFCHCSHSSTHSGVCTHTHTNIRSDISLTDKRRTFTHSEQFLEVHFLRFYSFLPWYFPLHLHWTPLQQIIWIMYCRL